MWIMPYRVPSKRSGSLRHFKSLHHPPSKLFYLYWYHFIVYCNLWSFPLPYCDDNHSPELYYRHLSSSVLQISPISLSFIPGRSLMERGRIFEVIPTFGCWLWCCNLCSVKVNAICESLLRNARINTLMVIVLNHVELLFYFIFSNILFISSLLIFFIQFYFFMYIITSCIVLFSI